MSYGSYLLSSEFGQALLENWQSEYLQFTLYILGTVWLVQRGSPESKELGQAGRRVGRGPEGRRHAHDRARQRWAKAGGMRTRVYSNSLVIVMIVIWLGSWLGQSVDGAQRPTTRSWLETRRGSAFLRRSTSAAPTSGRTRCRTGSPSSWPSASMAIFAVYLRQRGSPESKPVGAAHEATGQTG